MNRNYYNQNFISQRRRTNYNFGRNQNIMAFQSSVKLGPVTTAIMIGLMLAILGVIYLTQASRVTSYDYKISQVDSKIAELTARKTDLEIEKARLASIQTLSNSTVAQGMVPAGEVNYSN